MIQNTPIFEMPQILRPTVAGQMDANTYISSISEIDNELPNGIRTIGYLYWVNDEKQFYVFRDDITNISFLPLIQIINESSNVMLRHTATLVALTPYTITHNLNTQSVIISGFYNNKEIMIPVINGDEYGADSSNKITVLSNIDLTEVKLNILLSK